MKLEDYLKGEASATRHCAVRHLCPLGSVCDAGEGPDGQAPLLPAIIEVGRGELLWADLRFEQRAFIVRSGVFACIANLDVEREVPFALFGAGSSAGMAELYVSREVSSTYYLRAVTDAVVCSFPAKPLRKHLEALPSSASCSIVASAVLNMSSASYIQTKILSKPLVLDRLVMLFLYLRDLYARAGGVLDAVNLTHDEIALLVASDRVTATRALHRMEEDGLVGLGYKSVALKPALDLLEEQRSDVRQTFHIPR